MKLYTREEVEEDHGDSYFHRVSYPDATLDDIKAYLAEQGLVAVPAGPMRDYISTMRQALMEVAHAQREGAGWYTRGATGLYSQVSMWVKRGKDAATECDKAMIKAAGEGGFMKLRGIDDWGDGAYQAPRGDHRHNGVDVVNSPGDPVKSLTYGTVTKIGWCYSWAKYPDRKHLRYVQVTLDGNDFRYFYCKPTAAQGDKIRPGDGLGIAHDLQPFFPGITDHYHFEIIGEDGEFVNPSDMIPEIKEALR